MLEQLTRFLSHNGFINNIKTNLSIQRLHIIIKRKQNVENNKNNNIFKY